MHTHSVSLPLTYIHRYNFLLLSMLLNTVWKIKVQNGIAYSVVFVREKTIQSDILTLIWYIDSSTLQIIYLKKRYFGFLINSVNSTKHLSIFQWFTRVMTTLNDLPNWMLDSRDTLKFFEKNYSTVRKRYAIKMSISWDR